MKSAFKPFILCFLTVAILFTMVSCEWKSGPPKDSIQEGTDTGAVTTITDTPLDVFTSSEPELTIPEETTSAIILDETTPEPIVPQETTPGVQNSQESVPDYTTPKETTTSEEIKTPEEITTPEETTTPEEVTAPEPPHEHTIVNGQCVCGFVLVVENESLYDNDKDGKEDVFCFSAVLPERFISKNVIRFSAGEFDSGLSSWVGIGYEGGESHYYCRNDRKSYIVYAVEVLEAGVYEMAICQRMKDTEAHGAKFTVNADSDEKYTFATSYQFTDEKDIANVCENATTMNSYMFGIELELAAGVNYIKIELAPGVESGQYFREFYFVKTSN